MPSDNLHPQCFKSVPELLVVDISTFPHRINFPDSIPSDLPPPYQPPKSPIRILDDKGHHGDPKLHSAHRVASESTLDISAPSNTKIRLYGSNNTFNNYAPAPQLRPDLRPTPSMMMHWQPPGAPPRFFTPPLPPQRQQTYKPSCTSLRETAALHLLRRGAPELILHAFKPEVTCEHGVVHFKQHPYCGWDNCCSRRGCGR